MRQPAGLYKHAFAWAMNKFSGRYERLVAERKHRLLGSVHGTVLEIGPGTGPNFRYYPHGIRWIGMEPNPFMHRYLRENARGFGFDIDLRAANAEALPVEDASVDYVVGTLVLCSVPDVHAALREVIRVLRAGGRFLFLEHVAAPDGTRLRRCQTCVRPLWSKLADGCRPEQETWASIERAGFERSGIEHFRISAPIFSPHIIGTATKGDS